MEAVDSCLGSLEGLLVRNQVSGLSEHHHAMLDGRNRVSEPRFARVKHRAGCTDSELADGDPRGEGPNVYSVSFRRHPRAMIVESGRSVGIRLSKSAGLEVERIGMGRSG